MSNLDDAKAAIEAEIVHSRQGMAHYANRIESLTAALEQLSEMNNDPTSVKQGKVGRPKLSNSPVVPTKPGKASKVIPEKATAKKESKAKTGSKDENPLPFTGGDYWPNLLSEQPMSGSEILQKVISSLSFTPSKDQIQKLSQRMTFALNSLVKAGTIQDSGSGRERRFFRNANGETVIASDSE